MLPGFRFLFTAIVLSMSILIFGLGAAALLRAAHEEVASIPSRRAAPETNFAQQPSEPARPVLAMLRIEPPPAEQKAPDNVPLAAAPAEPAATTSPPAEPEKVAALKPAEALKPEEASPLQAAPLDSAKPEIPLAETPAQAETTPPPTETPAPAAETKVAVLEDAPLTAKQTDLPSPTASPAPPAPSAQAALPTPAISPASEEQSAPILPDAGIAATRIATLGGPPVTIEPDAFEAQPVVKATAAKSDDGVKKHEQARKAAKRRKIAARARVAARQAPQPADPFSQPTITVRSR